MAFIPKRTRYLGSLAVDPTPTETGQWWYNTTERNWKFFNGEITALLGGTFTRTVSISADEFGRPSTDPPTVVLQDNVILYSFALDKDSMEYKFPIPSDYHSGALDFWVVWTNDGGVDDQNRNAKWQLDYQTATEGDAVSGSHANSPKSVEDTYTSASGWIEHHSDHMSIAEADFTDKFCVYVKISAVTPVGTALTCDPHLLGLCFSYTAKRYVV